MRILVSKESRKILFNFLNSKYNSKSLSTLSRKLKISRSTLDNWRYDYKRYLPEEIIPPEILRNLDVINKQKENWGRVKGGKKTYKIIVEKYGVEEIRKRQSNGGRKSKRIQKEEKFVIDIKNPLFLEFYGILIGDGWLSKLKYKNKIFNLIGISGHAKLDRDFFLYCKKNIKNLFNRKAYLKERPKFNSIELNFTHKMFLKAVSEELNFPIGKKINLKINNKIYRLGYNFLKYTIRGIFDTDGCFYLDKTPVGRPYPCICISMKSPLLIKQLYKVLIREGFKVIYIKEKDGRARINLKGRKQLDKWMKEIGSSNPKHLNKINALVAQQDSATSS